jgi:hypothetical protein
MNLRLPPCGEAFAAAIFYICHFEYLLTQRSSVNVSLEKPRSDVCGPGVWKRLVSVQQEKTKFWQPQPQLIGLISSATCGNVTNS